MVYSLSYRRPARMSSSTESVSISEKAKSIDESISSGHSRHSAGIPEALSFDKILNGGVCPPCTLRDFLNYLKYIELSAENLQFFLWYRDYEKRFSSMPENEKVLAPVWTVAQEADALAADQSLRVRNVDPKTESIFQGTRFANGARGFESEKTNPFSTPPVTPHDAAKTSSDASFQFGFDDESNPSAMRYAKKADAAFEDAGLKWQPFTVQPYRDEISRIIAIYISDGGARQLNLSSKERVAVLHALENTTHPSAFRSILLSIEWNLRCQAHPNFIRWTICNGNRPRVLFARMLGVGGIVGGVATGVILSLSSASRAWRAMSLIGFMIGIATLIAAWKGMCVVLHGMHHRHLRPWELFVEEDVSEFEVHKDSLESIGSNSYEDEPWVAKYEKRNLVRKVFDREVWIQEPALRQIQDTIFIQAILGAFIISAIATGIFVALPAGFFF